MGNNGFTDMELLTPMKAFITISNQKLSKMDFQERVQGKGWVSSICWRFNSIVVVMENLFPLN